MIPISLIRKGHSTQSTLMKLTDDIRMRMDHTYVKIFLFDLSRAFDTVCHVTFLHKLRDAGFSRSALNWIISYLTSKEQAVIEEDGTP